MIVSIDRLVRNQVIFRGVNEHVREIAERFELFEIGPPQLEGKV